MELFRGFKNALIAEIVVIGLLVLSWKLAFGQEWHNVNQATVAWDAVTVLQNGDPVPDGNTVQYAVYMANAVTDPNKASPVLCGDNIAATQYTITFDNEGQWFIGVQAIRKDSDGNEVARSAIGWSDSSEAASVPFGFKFYVAPQDVTGLRVSGG